MSLNSEKSNLCSSGCARFVSTPNAKNRCILCLFKEFEAFLNERESNGTKQHHDVNRFLCKTFEF
jgi:hypothetical protein